MKHIIKKSILYIAPLLLFSACKKITDINTDPTAASTSQVQVEYFIDNSIIHAQMNPGVSERAFILYWTAAGHQISDADGATFSWGAYNDEWISEYYSNQSGALNTINSAIDVASQQITAGTQKTYTNNLMQVARIWRAYLISEMSDNFGPMPTLAFQGKNPNFNDVKSVYYYLLDELSDATSKLDLTIATVPSVVASEDPAYGFNFSNWQAYGNSLRLRLAMRLSEVDPSKAQSEFEAAAASGNLLTDKSQIFQIQEKPGWDDLSGMYSRCWYQLPEAVTFNNLVVNLGGITSQTQVPTIISDPASQSAAIANIKPANYAGQYYPVQMTTMTNNPYSAYWLDGLPATIDPRAYQIFYMPGNSSDPSYPNGTCGAVGSNTVGFVKDINGNQIKTIDAKYTWNATPDGNWGTKGGVTDNLFQAINIGATTSMVPSLKNQFRTQTAKRVFFAAWETYFLLAEGAVKGWATPVGAQTAYETGIGKSFEYWGISQYLPAYLASTDYNRAGTSVSWNSTTEPANTYTMNYVDGITGAPGTATINYPVNTLYQNGSVRNDYLTKIITQKFIAQTPWLPLETWNDHRRLGLPFFENVVLEGPIQTLPALTSSNYMTSNVQFFPQRMKYPSGLQNSNVNGYNQAVQYLGGADAVMTPLWWAQH
ncbi:MAG: SusD/RagB family nutrient-binding outer membrane lipoprotein [Bacteroidetes bacterium]|nr:SusD/RagB family nutrient-binding outer membrane lipoprotein [Bacteroidota bacterium]MBS1973957.1 SusD/RagB family nutrient-binding outer membrane lipoprotein [Bacteroidota bacterium]